MLKKQGDNTDSFFSSMDNAPLSKKSNNIEAGKRLRRAREAANLSQKKLADQLGVSAETVARWEKGERRPNYHARVQLQEVFGKDAKMFGFEESEEQDVPEKRDTNQPLLGNRQIIRLSTRRDLLIVGGGTLTLVAGYAGLSKWLQFWPWSPPHSVQIAQYSYKKAPRSLSWSPDGAYLASAHEDRAVLIWNKQTGDSIAYKGHIEGNGFVNAVAWCPTGKCLASVSGGSSPSIRVWSFPLTNTDLFVQKRNEQLTTVAWSHDGKYLAFGGRGTRIEVWEPLANQQTTQFDLPEGMKGIQDLSWSLDDKMLVVATNDKAIVFCNIDQRTTRAIEDAHTGTVETIAWSPVSPLQLTSGSADGTVKIWTMNSNTAQFTYKGHLKVVNDIDWSPDGNFIVSASADGTVHRWAVANGSLLEKYSGLQGDELYALDWSSDGKQLAFGGRRAKIFVWNTP